MQKYIYSIILLAINIAVLAQSDYKTGYIIANNNDTISGEIDLKSNASNSTLCKFRNDGDIIEYKPFDIKAYMVEDSKYYISKEVEFQDEKRHFFLELLVEGTASLFYLKNNSYDYYFLQKEDRIVMLDNDEIIIVKEDESDYAKDSDRYKGVMLYFYQDAPDLRSDILNAEFNYKSLINITKAYNRIVGDENESVEYSKTTKTDVYFEPYIGGEHTIMSFTNASDKITAFNTLFGANIIMRPLRAHYLWSMVAGVEYQKFSCSGSIYDYDSFASDKLDVSIDYSKVNAVIALRYSLPVKQFQPFVSAGLMASYIFNSEVSHTNHLSTFYQPKKTDLEIRSTAFNPVFRLGAKYKLKNSNYWFLEASYSRAYIKWSSSEVETPLTNNYSFRLGYAFK